MRLNKFTNNIKYYSYPDVAPGWVDKVYYPRVIAVNDEVPAGLVNEQEEYTEFKVKAWKEVEETG